MLSEDTLTHYKLGYNVEWVGNLPMNCPPEEILVPENEIFYRLIKNKDYIVDDDWKTYRELKPNVDYKGNALLLAYGLSILNESNSNLKKLPYFKNNFKGIAKITLQPIDGVVKKTGNNKSHYTWWRTTSFNINSAEIINNEES